MLNILVGLLLSLVVTASFADEVTIPGYNPSAPASSSTSNANTQNNLQNPNISSGSQNNLHPQPITGTPNTNYPSNTNTAPMMNNPPNQNHPPYPNNTSQQPPAMNQPGAY